nr:hypothetical protein [Sphingobacterium sp.]
MRDVKIKGRTAIPAGTYKLGINRNGGMNTAYKKRFPDMYEGMIEIRAIPISVSFISISAIRMTIRKAACWSEPIFIKVMTTGGYINRPKRINSCIGQLLNG